MSSGTGESATEPGGPRPTGFVDYTLPASFFDDLPEDELTGWEPLLSRDGVFDDVPGLRRKW